MNQNDIILKSDESSLAKISIVKNGTSFDLYPWRGKGNNTPIESLNFEENINSTVIGGTLILKDFLDWSGELNLHSFEKLIIELFEIKPENQNPAKIKKIEFGIISVSQISNKPAIVSYDASDFNIIRVDFCTNEPLLTTEEKGILNFDDDFVGYIATDGSGEIPGLINEIFKKLDVQNYEIEPTYNGIWIKSNEIAYPWGKSKGQLSLEKLFNYIKQYAVSKTNPNAVNYFLWRDLDGYHFKSLEKIINDQEENLEIFYFSNSLDIKNGIKDTRRLNEANVLELSGKDTFNSFYERVAPNYDDYYLDFVNDSLSFKKEIVDFDYHRDFSTWNSIEKYKIIPDDKETSVYIGRNGTPSQSLKVDDNIYGYYSKNYLNTPFAQEWDNIGASGNSRWNNVSFIPQYDITDLSLTTFHTIHKKIREPLKQKRAQYAYMKNLKRKWEVYRCSICCLSDVLGGTADQADIQRLQGIENPNENPEYLALFGATGIFGEISQEYKISAAGSFTDVYNYDFSNEINKGITLSYNLNEYPYNQTIKEFYSFKEDFSNYEQHIFNNAFKIYDTIIFKNETILSALNSFINQVDSWISNLVSIYTNNLDTVSETQGCGFDRYDPIYSNYSLYIFFTPPYCYRSSIYEDDWTTNPATIPPSVRVCSREKLNFYTTNNSVSIGSFVNRAANPFLMWNYLGVESNPLIEKLPIIAELNDILFTRLSTPSVAVYCPECTDGNLLTIKKRKVEKIIAILNKQNEIALHIKNTLFDSFYEKWKEAKTEYFNRKAFFISKQDIKMKELDNLKSPTSLFNIKSIKRMPIRGSRYEILARNKGITGAVLGEYLYKIFFDDDESRNKTTEGDHPYYDQKYKLDLGPSAFRSTSKTKKIKVIEDIVPENSPSFGTGYDPAVNIEEQAGGASSYYVNPDGYKVTGLVSMIDEYNPNFVQNTGLDSNYYLRTLGNPNNLISSEGYDSRYNIYDENIVNKKPVSLVKEEISSYVRIEFLKPIGLDRIVDFPNSFIRDAGYEYFLPYLVSLTSGPNGRQTINQNLVVIGMDPYGFDVAIKRIPDNGNGKYYWWSSGLDSPQMDLWPESIFETEYTYYGHKFIDESEKIASASYEFNAIGVRSVSTNVNSLEYLKYTLPYAKQSINDHLIAVTSTEEYLRGNNDAAKHNCSLSDVNYASEYLLNHSKTVKAIRNWWSFHIPDNIIIIPFFENVFANAFVNNPYGWVSNLGTSVITTNVKNKNVYAQYSLENNLRDTSDIEQFRLGETNIDTAYNTNNFYENYLDYDYSSPAVQQFLTEFDSLGIKYIIPNSYFEPKISTFKSNSKFNEVHPDIAAYFSKITNWWLSGDTILYRPGLVTEDVWKYDISGYSEYGLVGPPTNKNHPDIFDNNFAGQFIVFSKESGSVCEKSNLKCINPKGQTTTFGCPSDDPYCNCPARNRQPYEPEPSYLNLYKMEQEIKECALIEQELGEEWLGCVWSDPDNTASCNCPEIGDKFMDYLEYSRTYATFWNTPKKTPLLRNAQMNLLYAQTASVVVNRNDSIKVGSLIFLEDLNPTNSSIEFKNKYKRFYGKWLVTSVVNVFIGDTKNYMVVTLNRDSLPSDPNISNSPESIFK